MQQQGQSSDATGTRDDTYDVISVVYHALQGAENCEIYADDAEDKQLRNFFQSACDQQRQLAEQGKRVLAPCLKKDASSGRRPERILRSGLGLERIRKPAERDREQRRRPDRQPYRLNLTRIAPEAAVAGALHPATAPARLLGFWSHSS
jgi:hypothetical protein